MAIGIIFTFFSPSILHTYLYNFHTNNNNVRGVCSVTRDPLLPLNGLLGTTVKAKNVCEIII